MLLENLPSELLLEIFSYLHPSDLYSAFFPLSNSRLSHLISHADYSLDLISISYSRFRLILTSCLPLQIVFLRLTNQYSHSLLITEFFSFENFHPKNFLRLRSLHLDDFIGDEIDCLPPNLEKLYIKFHKKAKSAARFYRIALQSTTLKQCYLIGGYAFDSKTCSPISSTTIEEVHMAIKSFPNDLIALLQALPSLTKLKTRIYTQSCGIKSPCSFTSSLTHLNIDLHTSGISLSCLDSQLLCHLSRLRSLIYLSSGKLLHEDVEHLSRLSNRLKRIQFIRKGLSTNIDAIFYQFNQEFVSAIQEMTYNKYTKQSLILHTIPYPDKTLSLPFIQWNKIHDRHRIDQNIYDHVERIRINLSDINIPQNFPICRHVNHLTLMSTNESDNILHSPDIISSFICLSSIRHLIVNTQTSLINLNQLLPLMSLQSLDIAWSQLRPYFFLSNIKILSLISECVSWKEIQYLIEKLIPQLEHLQMNVTTSDECQQILNILLSPKYRNKLISIKICICQTLSDQIKQDLEPIFHSKQWINVQFRMDNWYLYIWK